MTAPQPTALRAVTGAAVAAPGAWTSTWGTAADTVSAVNLHVVWPPPATVVPVTAVVGTVDWGDAVVEAEAEGEPVFEPHPAATSADTRAIATASTTFT